MMILSKEEIKKIMEGMISSSIKKGDFRMELDFKDALEEFKRGNGELISSAISGNLEGVMDTEYPIEQILPLVKTEDLIDAIKYFLNEALDDSELFIEELKKRSEDKFHDELMDAVRFLYTGSRIKNIDLLKKYFSNDDLSSLLLRRDPDDIDSVDDYFSEFEENQKELLDLAIETDNIEGYLPFVAHIFLDYGWDEAFDYYKELKEKGIDEKRILLGILAAIQEDFFCEVFINPRKDLSEAGFDLSLIDAEVTKMVKKDPENCMAIMVDESPATFGKFIKSVDAETREYLLGAMDYDDLETWYYNWYFNEEDKKPEGYDLIAEYLLGATSLEGSDALDYMETICAASPKRLKEIISEDDRYKAYLTRVAECKDLVIDKEFRAHYAEVAKIILKEIE